MTDPHIAIPSRAPSATPTDDIVTPFEVAKLDLRGRVVRLGPVVDDILERHDYPQPIAKLVGEAIVLTVMLGSALKIDGPQSVVFDEAENRLHVQKGILAWCLHANGR